MKQIFYFEEQNKQLKEDLNASSEKYFEEKKKWQQRLREMDSKQKELSKKLQEALTAVPSVHPPSDKSTEDSISKRLQELELKIAEKVSENKQNVVAKVVAESKIAKLEKEINNLKASQIANSAHSISRDNQMLNEEQVQEEMRALRASVAELDVCLRRKTREVEKLEKDMRNQLLLQEQISGQATTIASLQAMVSQLQQAVRSIQTHNQINKWNSYSVSNKSLLSFKYYS